MSENKKPDNTAKLIGLLGRDPTRPAPLTEGILADALKELREKEEEQARTTAKEVILQAVELSRQRAKIKADFLKQDAKFEKQLGQLLARLNTNPNAVPAKEAGTDDEPAAAEPAE